MGGFVPKCWNCAGKHSVNECTQPNDQKQIEANCKKFMDKKKGQGKGVKNGKDKKFVHNKNGNAQNQAKLRRGQLMEYRLELQK